MPPFGSGVRHWINRNVLLRLVARTARQLGMRDVLVWTYLPTDTVLDLIGRLETQLSAIVYYCLADFPQVSLAPDRITMSEEQLVRSSNVVFVNCQTLANRFGPWTKDVYVFLPGVDVAAFSPLDLSSEEVDIPEELRLLPRPIGSTLCSPAPSRADCLHAGRGRSRIPRIQANTQPINNAECIRIG